MRGETAGDQSKNGRGERRGGDGERGHWERGGGSQGEKGIRREVRIGENRE